MPRASPAAMARATPAVRTRARTPETLLPRAGAPGLAGRLRLDGLGDAVPVGERHLDCPSPAARAGRGGAGERPPVADQDRVVDVHRPERRERLGRRVAGE